MRLHVILELVIDSRHFKGKVRTEKEMENRNQPLILKSSFEGQSIAFGSYFNSRLQAPLAVVAVKKPPLKAAKMGDPPVHPHLHQP